MEDVSPGEVEGEKPNAPAEPSAIAKEEPEKRDEAAVTASVVDPVVAGEDEKPVVEPESRPIHQHQPHHQNTVKDENGFYYYKCRFCGLSFNYITTLKAHERVHDIDQPFVCNKCGEAFHFACELEYHAQQHLKGQKGYKCECGRTFYKYTDLLYHHHPGEDEPLTAPSETPPTLPLQPSSSSLLFARSATMDPADFPTPAFMSEGFEPKHQVRQYSDVRSRPYICQYCSKSYSDSRGLAYHMYSHRGERNFNPRASRYLMCRNDNSYISPGVPL